VANRWTDGRTHKGESIGPFGSQPGTNKKTQTIKEIDAKVTLLTSDISIFSNFQKNYPKPFF